MPTPLSGPGLGLPLPQSLYPTALNNAPYDASTNQVCLNAGDQLPLPAGTWFVSLGMYLILEQLDPVTGLWTMAASATQNEGGLIYVKSDGFTSRIANRLGCPIGGIVTSYGGGWVQASTTISVTGGGGSTWVPIVGGQVTTAAATIVAGQGGAGYGVPPIVIIPAPPPPANNPNGVGGIAASGYCGIASGTVSGFTFTNPGAGYPTAPGNNGWITLLANPTDPNISSGITLASISLSLTGSGSITGAICTNPGNPLSTPSNITLTVAGVGTNATVIPAMLQTITACTVVGTSTLTGVSGAAVTAIGGGYSLGTVTNSPEYLGIKFRPRQPQIQLAIGGVGTMAPQVGTIIDGGMFASPPSAILQTLNTASNTTLGITGASTVSFVMGSRPDIAVIQSAP